jgi:formylglycine-generating enzyme required for sulfatase activity
MVTECSNCHNQVEDDGDFCEHCGGRVFQLANSDPQPVAARNSGAERPVDESPGLPDANRLAYQRLRRAFASFAGLVVLVAGVLAFSVSRQRLSEDVRTANVKTGNQVTHDPAPSIRDGMVYVPGGTFTMGNDVGDDFEKPAHAVVVKPFLIDAQEVTVADYKKFIEATGRRVPANWRSETSGSERVAVTGVDWFDAAAYAAWSGKRLPTESEWELAARGFDRRTYPWGNEWHSGFANAGDSSAGRVVEASAHPQGRSPFGALDMVGNAWEWTASDLEPYPNSRVKLPSGIRKVIRGGSWALDSPADWTTTFRGFALPAGGKDYTKIGFRCVMDVEVPER